MTPEQILDALAEPFEATEVKFKPQSVKGNRALALCYIDARVVQDRLDDVLGVANWSDSYEIVADGSVVCRLALKIGGEWVTKTDVGSPSEQPDQGDRLKAAFSDALKRAAVKFGVGRYIYRIPNGWCDYDPQKRAFTAKPQLPAWALPKKQSTKPAPAPYSTPEAEHPPAATTPADTLYSLLEELAAIRRVKTEDLVGKVVAVLDPQAASLDDLKPAQLRDGIASTRKKLAGERPKGQQTLTGPADESPRGLPD